MGESLLVHILNLGVPGCRIAKAVYPRMNSGRLQDLNEVDGADARDECRIHKGPLAALCSAIE